MTTRVVKKIRVFDCRRSWIRLSAAAAGSATTGRRTDMVRSTSSSSSSKKGTAQMSLLQGSGPRSRRGGACRQHAGVASAAPAQYRLPCRSGLVQPAHGGGVGGGTDQLGTLGALAGDGQ